MVGNYKDSMHARTKSHKIPYYVYIHGFMMATAAPLQKINFQTKANIIITAYKDTHEPKPYIYINNNMTRAKQLKCSNILYSDYYITFELDVYT